MKLIKDQWTMGSGQWAMVMMEMKYRNKLMVLIR